MPIVIAHRGGASLAPENTLAAFRNAHGRFEDVWLELDVRLARDGIPVVLHDRTLDRTTDRTGSLDDLDAADLAAANAAALWPEHPPEPVPTFAQVLAEGAAAGWRLMVELKTEDHQGSRDLADAALETIARTGYRADDLFCACFHPAVLDRLKEREPTIRTAVLTSSMAPRPGTTADAVRIAAERGHDLVGPDLWSPDLGAESVERAHDAGLEVIVWTVNDPDDALRLAEAGVDGTISDRPDAVYDALGG